MRGTLPRFRYDQLMKFALTFMFPLGMVIMLATAAVVAVGMWESGDLCRISKRGGKGGKLVFGVFRAFLGASFPQRGARAFSVFSRTSPDAV